MKRSIFSVCLVFLLILVAGCGAPKPISDDASDVKSNSTPAKKVVRVGFFEGGKFMSGASDDSVKDGYAYEYLQMVANQAGWRYQYVYGSWSQLYEKFLAGDIDLLPDVSYTAERAQKFSYPDAPMGHEIYYIACRSDNEEIDWNNLSTFNGIRIGVEKNSIQVKMLGEWIAKNHLSCTVVPLSGGKQSELDALEAGAIDALVTTHFKGKIHGVSNVAVLGQSDYYLAVTKHRQDLLQELNVAQGKISDAHPVFMTKQEYKYFPDAMVDQRLTAAEKEWLARKKEIKIGYSTNNMPFSALDLETGKPTGLITDVINSICNSMNIDNSIFTYVPYDNWKDMRIAMAEGEIDVVFGTYKNLSWAEKGNIAQTDNIVNVDICKIMPANSNRDNVKKIGISMDNPQMVFIYLLGLDKYEMVFYQTKEDAFEAVRRGDVDCTFSNEFVAQSMLRGSEFYNGLRVVDRHNDIGVCMAVRWDEVTLLSIFNRGISMLDQRVIEKSLNNYSFQSMKTNLKDVLLEYWWLSIIVGIIFLLILLILFIVYRGRQRIARINDVLRSQKDMLQAANDSLVMANQSQMYANEELTAKNDEINELFDKQQDYIDIIERNHEALKSANWAVGFDPLGQIETINWSDGLRHILGYNDVNDFPDTLDSILNIIHPDDLKNGAKFINELKLERSQTSNIIDMEVRLFKKDKDYVWFRIYARMSRRQDGTPRTLYGVCQDIEEYKEMLEKTEQALFKAQQASQAKSIFLSNMSHDMRTPMNGIIGYTTLALDNIDKQPVVKEYLDKIKMVSKHLLSLINDVLDMSRIESGRIELDPQPTNLIALVDELKSILQSDIEMNRLKFQIDTDGIYNDTVVCDRLRMKQVLLNLLSNAVKFTKDGTISLRLVEIAEDKHTSQMSRYEFHVEDEGIGIDKAFIDKIFTPFEREKSTTVSGIQGTGLGMSITKSIVDMMGGSIQVESELGKGTHFTVSLELKTCMHQDLNTKPESAAKYDFTGRSVLLVDDNAINQEIAKALLENVNLEVGLADNGTEAVEKVKNEAQKYDCILMDIQMPVMDGYEATRNIRKLDSEYAQTVPIVAMTANVFAEDKQKALDAGMNGHVAKPIDIKELYSTLNTFINK